MTKMERGEKETDKEHFGPFFY